MSFIFRIEDAFEVHKDPGGHHHHWTILYGEIEEGSLRIRDFICIPYVDGSHLICRVGGIKRAHHSLDNLKEVSVDTADSYLGLIVMVAWPAPDAKRVERGGAAHSSSEEARYENIIWSLENDPIRLFHQQGEYGQSSSCMDCVGVLRGLSELEGYLEKLLSHSDPYIIQCAERILEAKLRSKSLADTQPPWYAFWKKRR